MPETEKSSQYFDQIVGQLSNPNFYPHPVEQITKIETHISVVFLTGDYAYKLKKPVDFGFLDFTQIPQRLKFCQKELELNQRTAKDLYLAVISLYENDGIISLKPSRNSQSPIDCILKMRQFNPGHVLGNYLQSHSLSSSQISALASQIADLHLHSKVVEAKSEFGEPEIALKPMLDNFPSLTRFLNSLPNSNQALQSLEKIQKTTLQQFESVKSLLINRKQNGFIRNCHGDLHLDNITLVNDSPMLFDAIEFNDYFSHIDVISDMAFLLVDLDFRGRPELAWVILSYYLHFTQDYSALQILGFYKVYRAMVRAKISALQAEQNSIDSPKYNELKEKTLRYLDLANQLQTKHAKPKIILIQGISGSGKSVLAQRLVKYFDAIIISSDRTRKKLFKIEPTERVDLDVRPSLYSESMNQKTYETLLNNARLAITSGCNVIIDATFLKKSHRDKFYELAMTLEVECYLLSIHVDERLALESIKHRNLANNDPSDADEKIMQRQMKMIEEPTPKETQTQNILNLEAHQLREELPITKIKKFLNLPI